MQGRQSSPVLSEQLKEKECETDSICLYETRQDMRRIEECRRICPDMDYVALQAARRRKPLRSHGRFKAAENRGNRTADGKSV